MNHLQAVSKCAECLAELVGIDAAGSIAVKSTTRMQLANQPKVRHILATNMQYICVYLSISQWASRTAKIKKANEKFNLQTIHKLLNNAL